jgi:outer membrane protein OmpA-like peptidoglycan-associated protein
MNLKSKAFASAFAALVLAAPSLALADSLQGIIVNNLGNKIVLRTPAGDTTLVITSGTKIQQVIGLIGARREDRPSTDLIRGLAVSVDTVTNGSEVDAGTITFKADDLKTALAVQAGTAEAQAQTNARLNSAGQYSIKAQTKVFFASGSTAINAKGKSDLKAIASQAMTIQGGLVRVVGFADTTGNAALNQRLSDQRASAVTAYLVSVGLPPNKFVSSSGLGDATAQNDDTPSTQAQARRVTVSVVVPAMAQAAPTQIQ